MKEIKILSWNVNGIRAAYKKGFLNWFLKESPDILCVQEFRATEEQLPGKLINIEGYHSYFNSAEKKGSSGVAIYTKVKPENVRTGFGIDSFDREGRVQIAEYENFILFNIYYPNGGASDERLKYKLEFYNIFLKFVDKEKEKGKGIICCGDFNTAHNEIDLSRPKENSIVSGFLPIERAWLDKFISHGYQDTFRIFNKNPENYTWWDYKTRARDRNVGWRLDYFFINQEFIQNLHSAFILSEVMGSDHCPVGIEIEIDK